MPILHRRTLLILLLLAGCDDKRTANSENFARALQIYFDDHPECNALPIDFPIGTPIGTADPRRGQTDPLVEAGLLVRASAMPATVQYSLTTAGEKSILKGADPFLGGMTLCYAHRRIVKVTAFTPPADILGAKASRVTYDFELRDIAPWSKAGSIQNAFPQIKAALAASSRTGTEGIVLTSDGWMDEHLVR